MWVFVKEYGNFFTRGNQLFAEQQELLIGDEVTRMRAAYKQIERKMQDRHTFVPKVRHEREMDQFNEPYTTPPFFNFDKELVIRISAVKFWNFSTK